MSFRIDCRNEAETEPCEAAERATAEPLAKGAVAHVSTKWFARYAISDRSAYTTALMDLGHLVLLVS